MSNRPKIPDRIQSQLFDQSRRRCAICYALDGDLSEKSGQIAHLDHQPTNNTVANLCFLCLNHHDRYDSRTSQSKGLSEHEVKGYRDKLYARLASGVDLEVRRAGDVSVSADVAAGSGTDGPGGDVRIEGGTGRRGASGGNVTIGPGHYRGGDGGFGGKGGDLIIKGGDAE
jgi:hypothetical protein